MKEQEGKLIDFKGFNWKTAIDEKIIRFGKTTDFPERGISIGECKALLEALKVNKMHCPNILETGQMFGTSTRIFIGWALRNSGATVYSCEIKPQPLFKEKMEEAGYWQYVHQLGDSRVIGWQIPIGFLFIDSRHLFQDALGEYMRFRFWLKDGGIVGFHDTDNCTGVKLAIQIAKMIDDLEPISQSNEASGIEFYRIKKHETGGLFIRQLDYLNEELKATQDKMEIKRKEVVTAYEKRPK